LPIRANSILRSTAFILFASGEVTYKGTNRVPIFEAVEPTA